VVISFGVMAALFCSPEHRPHMLSWPHSSASVLHLAHRTPETHLWHKAYALSEKPPRRGSRRHISTSSFLRTAEMRGDDALKVTPISTRVEQRPTRWTLIREDRR
jgi:hypothetical protein